MRKRTLGEFIYEARKVHGDKYDYSRVVYESSVKKVCIICPEHGEFWQVPNNHLFGGEHFYELTQKRDAAKKRLCEEHSIRILYYSNAHIEYPYPVF